MQVNIVPVGDVSAVAKREAVDGIREKYDCPVHLDAKNPPDIPARAKNTRGQYQAETILDVMNLPRRDCLNLLIIDSDLNYRDYDFVFGTTHLEGDLGIFSTFRLDSESAPGGTTSMELFMNRVRKQAIKQVGFMLGLKYCDRRRCVMHNTDTVSDLDETTQHFCTSCQNSLSSSFQNRTSADIEIDETSTEMRGSEQDQDDSDTKIYDPD